MKFVQIIDNIVVPAPAVIITENSWNLSPRDQDYLADPRYYELVDNPLEPKEGFNILKDGYHISNKQVIMQYKYEKITYPPNIYSKYKIISKLISFGQWTEVKPWLVEIGYYDLFEAALNLKEDDENFVMGLRMFCQKFGKTEEEVKVFLNDCLMD